MIPLRGVSMIDADGQPFHDPAADRALFDSLRSNLGANVTVKEIDAHINDPAFAQALATNCSLCSVARLAYGDHICRGIRGRSAARNTAAGQQQMQQL